jgi:acetyltransferase-like isoleucine patch superfamily enzyme/ubiquinone/menaquinone biosynthesis C-methylase UbiE
MYFSEKLQIKDTDKVLEIGPGAFPHPRSDYYLDKIFNEDIAYSQRGNNKAPQYNKPIIYYEQLPLPFKDKEFDYVICSHVIEHIPLEELPFFIKELERISYRGYMEFPNMLFELINYHPIHLWFMNYKNETMIFLDKKIFQSSFFHKIYREMFFSTINVHSYYKKYKHFLFCGFEWNGKIKYEIIDNYKDLFNENEIFKLMNTFKEQEKFDIIHLQNNHKLSIQYKIMNYIKNKLFQTKSLLYKKQKYYVAKTAQLSNKRLIYIGDNSEIKDYCIINVIRDMPIEIGEFTQINPFTVIFGGGGVKIGNHVMIAPHCVIATGNHNYHQIEKPMRLVTSIITGPIVIEDDVWIGANSTITDGVTIKKGAVVGANSVVTKDVGEYEIVAGTPAKKIGSRI